MPNTTDGWVTVFTRWLDIRLASKLGRADRVRVWRDPQLLAGDALPDELQRLVRGAGVFVAFLSPGYVASDWCRKELALFLDEQQRRRPGHPPNIVIVGFDEVSPPPELANYLHVRFWEEDPDTKRPRPIGFPVPDVKDPRCVERMEDVVAGVIGRLSAPPPAGAPVPPGPAPAAVKGTVVLAEVTDDLDDLRDQVRRHLTQEGYRVLPEGLYPADEAGFRSAVRADLDSALLFVQLLSAVPGRRLGPTGERRVAVQHALAAGGKKPVIQWRQPKLDLTQVADGPHRALLEGADEFTTATLEEFKQAVVGRLEQLLRPPPKAPAAPDGVGCSIFVNTDDSDRDLADQINAQLAAHNAWVFLPTRTGQVDQDRQDYEANVQECDGLLLVYGRTAPHWVMSQLRQVRKILPRRERPLAAIGVYEGPPPKPDLGFNAPNLHWLRSPPGLTDQAIDDFLDRVRAGRRAE